VKAPTLWIAETGISKLSDTAGEAFRFVFQCMVDWVNAILLRIVRHGNADHTAYTAETKEKYITPR
jgi:hypothetical protein